MGHALRERRKNDKRKKPRRPDMSYSYDMYATTPEALGPHRAKPPKRADSSRGDELQHQISVIGAFTSGHANEPTDMERCRFFQDQQITTASAVTQVLDITPGYTLDDTDLPANFDIDSIF